MAPVLTRQRLEAERLREEDGRVVVPFRAAHVVIQVESGYWLDSVKYLEAEERAQHMPTLFDLGEAS